MSRLEWYVPRSLDDTPRFLLLDLQQLIGAVVMLSLGLVGGSMLGGLAVAVVFVKIYARLRVGRHPQFVIHLAYWYLPAWVLQLKSSPPSHHRLYLG